MFNLSVTLEDSAKRHPEKTAFTYLDTTLNFEQLNNTANQVANGLIEKGMHLTVSHIFSRKGFRAFSRRFILSIISF